MNRFPPVVKHDLPGWILLWTSLSTGPGSDEALAELRRDVAARARASRRLETIADDPTAAAVRKLFRAAGCDPTRYRPSSEALLRRVLKGEELPAINPFVDVNNCLSVELLVPACVMDVTRIAPPFVLRAGRAGESMLSMRGHFELEGKPLLEDSEGPFGTPITDSERVRVTAETAEVWLVAYLPAGVVDEETARTTLARLLGPGPGAPLLATASTR